MCIDNFPRPCFWINLWTWSRGTEIGHPHPAKFNSILSAISSQIRCGLSSLIRFHFFSGPRPMNDHCPFPKLYANREKNWNSSDIILHCLLIHKKCRSKSTERWFFMWNSLVSPLISTIKFSLLHWAAASDFILWKYSTRISLANRRFWQSFCNFKIWTILIFVPMCR